MGEKTECYLLKDEYLIIDYCFGYEEDIARTFM